LPGRELRQAFAGLESQARNDLRAEGWSGTPGLERSLDLRYRGQGFELNVAHSPRTVAEFHALHRQRYGYSDAARELELVTLRLRASLRTAPVLATPRLRPKRAAKPQRARVFFDGRARTTAILAREALAPGRTVRGPAIVTEYSATTVIPVGFRFHIDRAANLVIDVPAT
jgi:N-methylhydantoinase A